MNFVTAVTFVIIVVTLLSVPMINVWQPDSERYGDSWCNYETKECFSTEGHYTKKKVSIITYLIKYINSEESEQ